MKPTSDLFPFNGRLLHVQKNHIQVTVADLGVIPSLRYYDLFEESEKVSAQKLRCGFLV